MAQNSPPPVWADPEARSWLGVGVIELSEERARERGLSNPRGVEIVSVASDSPAAKAGVRKNDIVLRYGRDVVDNVDRFARLVRDTPVGMTVDMFVLARSGRRETRRVTIGERPQTLIAPTPPPPPRVPNVDVPDFDIPRPVMVVRNRALGAELEEIEGQLAQFFGTESGVLVRRVSEDSPASRGGLRAGDVITNVGGSAVTRPSDVRRRMSNTVGDTIDFVVLRKGAPRNLRIETGRERLRGSLRLSSNGRR